MSKRLSMGKIVCFAISAFIIMQIILPCNLTVYAASDVSINWNDLKQEIDGFGASQAADVYADAVYNLAARSEVMDLLFSQTNGIGLSILRCEVGSGLNLPTIEPQDGVWDFNGYTPELWVINEAKSRGVDKIFSTVWSPPAWMKTTNRIVRGGYLRDDCFQKYAEYLAEYVNGYKRHHNIDIYAVSLANEPEYAAPWQSCLWTDEMFKNFIANYLKPTFENKGVPAKVIVGEKGWWNEDIVVKSLNDPIACSRIDIVGGHQYNGTIKPFVTARSKGKRVWETEVSDTGTYKEGIDDGVYWAKKVHNFMTVAEANAFLYWLGACGKNNNESLIRLNEAAGTYNTTKRLYTFGHFSKFIRPGYVRIGATESPISGVAVSAYKDAGTGNFSIVIINDSDTNRVLNIAPNGFTAGKVTQYITNEEVNMQKCPDIPVKNGRFTVSSGAKSVITLIGTNGSLPEPEVAWTITDDLNDWSKVYSISPNWMLEGNDPYGGFDEDPSRARRTKLSAEHIIYRYNNITDFTAQVYYHIALQGMEFYTSPDGVNWSPLGYNIAHEVATGGGWHRMTVTPQSGIPSGTGYLKIEFSLGGKEWDKHLAQIKLLCDLPQKIPTDTLSDWSKTYSRTGNWMLDSGSFENFEGDTSRARRTKATTESIVYAAPGDGGNISSFEAKLFYFRSNSAVMNFYTYVDGQLWTKLDVTFTGAVPTGGYWSRMYCQPSNGIPTGTKFLKIEFSGGGLYPWDKQLAEITINY